ARVVPLCPRLVGVGLGAVLVLCFGVGIAAQVGMTEDWLREELAKHYPVAATDEVRTRGYPGPVYNHFNWGGYLIWRLPHVLVSMDGRCNIFGDALMERSIHTTQGLRNWKGQPEEGWDTDPELAAAKMVFLQADLPLVALLRQDRRFRLVYEDRVAVVFVARN